MIKYIANIIATELIKKSEHSDLILDVKDDSVSVFEFFTNFQLNVIKYASLYILFWLTLIIIAPGLTFYFISFGWSVFTFILGVFLGIYLTIETIRKLPKYITQEVKSRTDNVDRKYTQKIKDII